MQAQLNCRINMHSTSSNGSVITSRARQRIWLEQVSVDPRSLRPPAAPIPLSHFVDGLRSPFHGRSDAQHRNRPCFSNTGWTTKRERPDRIGHVAGRHRLWVSSEGEKNQYGGAGDVISKLHCGSPRETVF